MDVENATTDTTPTETGVDKEKPGPPGASSVGTVDDVATASESGDAVEATPTSTSMPSLSGKKRNRAGGGDDGDVPTLTNVSAASAAAASQLSSSMGLLGLASLLSVSASLGGSSSSNNNSSTLPTIDQVQQHATKSIVDAPPFLHLSKADSAPQLKIGSDRMSVKGGMRGYRMTRASHGVPLAGGNYYYEVLIQEPPSIHDIVNSLPPNARISKKLQEEMQMALKLEEKRKDENKDAILDNMDKDTSGKSPMVEKETNMSVFGSHVRLGWSMRTGDLQAPVGYDKWSYGVRDIGGSKIHCSKREDHWGGEEFGPGDVVGCAISMVPDSSMDGVATASNNRDSMGSTGSSSHQQRQAQLQQPQANQNHIRFFKNGYPMGKFVISKGKREGGAAFIIPDGVYYPAISLYMGACVKVNFGPHFIYQPRKLPTGLKVQPLSILCSPPISAEEAALKIAKERPFRKPDMLQKFLELVQSEVHILQDSYQAHRSQHVNFVMEERTKRGLKTEDVQSDKFLTRGNEMDEVT
jgi:Set1/Ash2 histone methyltransferase complex subunit ASH2